MSKMYFISKSVNNASKNKLDEALHHAFNKVINHVISEEYLPELDKIFQDTVNMYKANGGRVQPWKYSRYKPEAGSHKFPAIYIHVSDSCHFYLSEIRGEVLPF